VPAAQTPSKLKAQKLEGFAVSSIMPVESQEAGFVRCQRQAVSSEPFA
jgi:hypothetical protein